MLGFLIGSSRAGLQRAVSADDRPSTRCPRRRWCPSSWCGSASASGRAVLTAFLISFFPITVNIATGLATLEPELEDVLRVLGAKRWDVLVKVGLPRSMPYFYGSLKVAITLAFVGTTCLAEMTAGDERHRLPAHADRRQLSMQHAAWPSAGLVDHRR